MNDEVTSSNFILRKATKKFIDNSCERTFCEGIRKVITEVMSYAYTSALRDCGFIQNGNEFLVYYQNSVKKFKTIEEVAEYTNLTIARILQCLKSGQSFKGFTFDIA